jgi:hypothetical protein
MLKTAVKPCVHYWLIEDTGLGICRKCGTRHQYPLTFEEAMMQIAPGRRWCYTGPIPGEDQAILEELGQRR